jgi:hypothetical protein
MGYYEDQEFSCTPGQGSIKPISTYQSLQIHTVTNEAKLIKIGNKKIRIKSKSYM